MKVFKPIQLQSPPDKLGAVWFAELLRLSDANDMICVNLNPTPGGEFTDDSSVTVYGRKNRDDADGEYLIEHAPEAMQVASAGRLNETEEFLTFSCPSSFKAPQDGEPSVIDDLATAFASWQAIDARYFQSSFTIDPRPPLVSFFWSGGERKRAIFQDGRAVAIFQMQRPSGGSSYRLYGIVDAAEGKNHLIVRSQEFQRAGEPIGTPIWETFYEDPSSDPRDRIRWADYYHVPHDGENRDVIYLMRATGAFEEATLKSETSPAKRRALNHLRGRVFCGHAPSKDGTVMHEVYAQVSEFGLIVRVWL